MPARRVLPSFYLYQATASCVFYQPIFFLYYGRYVGLSEASILWLLAYYMAARALLELPFGALADRWSRRGCLVATGVSMSGGACVLLLWPSMAAVIVAETAFAAAHALRSGADSALLYDALMEVKQLELYPHAESRARALSAFGSGMTAVVGGILADVDLRWPYVATAVAGLLSAFLATRLLEAPRHATRVLDGGLMREAAAMVARSRAMLWSIALAVFAVVVSHVYFYLQQPYLKAVAVPVWMFGAVFAATKLVTAVTATQANRMDERVGSRGAAVVMTTVSTVGIGAMAAVTSPLGALLILSRGLLDGLWEPLVNVYMNRLAPARLRATLLSLQSFMARLGLSATLALLGWSRDLYGLRPTLAAAAVGALLAGSTLAATAQVVRE